MLLIHWLRNAIVCSETLTNGNMYIFYLLGLADVEEHFPGLLKVTNPNPILWKLILILLGNS